MVKFPKILLGDDLKEFIDWESVISSVKSDLYLKNVNIWSLFKMFEETGPDNFMKTSHREVF